METIIWDDEDAPGLESLTDEEFLALTYKMGQDLLLLIELSNATDAGQIH